MELERELEGEREVREALALRVVSLQQELSRVDTRLRALEHHHSFVASQLTALIHFVHSACQHLSGGLFAFAQHLSRHG